MPFVLFFFVLGKKKNPFCPQVHQSLKPSCGNTFTEPAKKAHMFTANST